LCLILSTILIFSILIMNGVLFSPANAQTENCYNLESRIALPVLLIHGWNEGSGGDFPIHFDEWEQELNQDRIPYCIISFEQSSDACGSAVDHANELAQIIQNIKSATEQNQVNIVGFSKGGLDARVYLANNPTHNDVANLIMIGTPNAGSQLATGTNECSPGILDLRPGSTATMAGENSNTEYYTIAGACFLIGDGLVSTASVDSQPYFESLGTSNACHADLLGAYEYELAYDVLIGQR
jgi:pimeloyl-ACP methyl ester carboxylesterase